VRVHEGLDGLSPERFRRPVVTVGVFDGLHRGHRHVLEHLKGFARRLAGESVVLTFGTHPLAVIAGAPPRQILSVPHRLKLLERLGLDAAVVLPFDERTRRMPFERFVADVLVARLGIAGLLFGYNANFGVGGLGTATTVAPLAARHGFVLEEAPAIALGERPISSSRIRDAIEQGALAEAAEMLGRPVSLYGLVVRGDGRGKELGFPTANVDLEGEIHPPTGVYAVVAELRGRRYPAVANLGVRPTFHSPGTSSAAGAAPVLEVHVPGLSDDLYGERLELELVRRLRDERRFPSREALVAQIRADVAAALSAIPAPR
jgi:riboflavin kinase / FMN adenylyltransferase